MPDHDDDLSTEDSGDDAGPIGTASRGLTGFLSTKPPGELMSVYDLDNMMRELFEDKHAEPS